MKSSMKCDIVFPNDNEEKFIKLGKDLGFDCLIFVYDSPEKFFKEENKTSIKIFNAVISKKEKVLSARKKSNLVLVESTGDDRDVFERYKPDLIFAIEDKQKKDFMHQRGSGLNSVFAKLANKNNISVAFSFASLLKNERIRERIIGRMMQNIKLCRKYKVSTIIASFAKHPYEMRAYHDLVAFFTNLGMHPKETKSSLANAIKMIRI